MSNSDFKQPAPAPADRAHGWVWLVLPVEGSRPAVVGDRGLADSLSAMGLEPVELDARLPGRDELDTVLISLGRSLTREEAARVRAGLGRPAVVAVALTEPRPDRDRSRRAGHVLGHLTALAAAWRTLLRARKAVRRLRGSGLAVSRVAVTRTSRGYALGAPPPTRGCPRLPDGAIVLGRSGAPRRSVLDEASAEAARVLGTALERRAMTVLSTGTLMVELGARDEGVHLLRVAGGAAEGLLVRSLENIAALADARPPAAVTRRLVAPLACGRAGPALWTVEPKLPGDVARRMTATLWEECLDFLIGLRSPSRSPTKLPARADDGLERDLHALKAYAGRRGQGTLTTIERELERRLDAVPRGWTHGDFWPDNLLVYEGSLLAVLDWDSAEPHAPAMFDLLHLIALSDPALRRLPHGRRCVEVLWPLARAGGDERMRRYCAATASPYDPATLVGLAIAYWVSRVGRDLRTYANRPSRPRWMEENLHGPLRTLGRMSW